MIHRNRFLMSANSLGYFEMVFVLTMLLSKWHFVVFFTIKNTLRELQNGPNTIRGFESARLNCYQICFILF